jgi:hypothetical protein
MRFAEEDGARTVQAIYLSPARIDGKLHDHQAGKEMVEQQEPVWDI